MAQRLLLIQPVRNSMKKNSKDNDSLELPNKIAKRLLLTSLFIIIVLDIILVLYVYPHYQDYLIEGARHTGYGSNHGRSMLIIDLVVFFMSFLGMREFYLRFIHRK